MFFLQLLISLVCVFAIVQPLPAQTPEAKPKQFIYVLRLVPRLHSDSAWTQEDKMALDRHFARFQHAIETGELILAGRTREPGDKTFGSRFSRPTMKQRPGNLWRAILRWSPD